MRPARNGARSYGRLNFGVVNTGTTGVVCPPYKIIPPISFPYGTSITVKNQKNAARAAAQAASNQAADIACLAQVSLVQAQQAQAKIDAANALAYQAQLAASAQAARDQAAAAAAATAAQIAAVQKAAADEAAHVAAEQAAQWAEAQAQAKQIAAQAATAKQQADAAAVLAEANRQAAAWAAQADATARDQAAQAAAANAAAATATQAAATHQTSLQDKIATDAAAAQVKSATAAAAAVDATNAEYAAWQVQVKSGPVSTSTVWKKSTVAASPADAQIAYVLRRWAGHQLWEVPEVDRQRLATYLRLAWDAGAQFPRSATYTPIVAAVETVATALIRRDASERNSDRDRWAADLLDVRFQDRVIKILPTVYQEDWGTFGIAGFHIENNLGQLGAIVGAVAGSIIPVIGTGLGAAIGAGLGKLGTAMIGTRANAQTGKAAQGVIVGLPVDFMALNAADLLRTSSGVPIDATGNPVHPLQIATPQAPQTSTMAYVGLGVAGLVVLSLLLD